MKKRKSCVLLCTTAIILLLALYVTGKSCFGNQEIQNSEAGTEAVSHQGTVYDENGTEIEKREISGDGKIVYDKDGTVIEKREISENGKIVYDKNGTEIEKREISETNTK